MAAEVQETAAAGAPEPEQRTNTASGPILPRRLGRRLVFGATFGLVVIAGLLAFAKVGGVRRSLGEFRGVTVLLALGLALGNYVIRFARWHLYLRRVGARPAPRRSALVFTAGFVMAVSPGKVGEVLKSYLLRELDGTPMARTTPVVIAERLTDLIALLLLGLVGLRAFAAAGHLVIAGVVLVAVGVAGLSSRRLSLAALRLAGRLPVLRGVAHRMEDFYDSMASLIEPVPLAYGTVLGAAAWMCECLGFWLIVGGFRGASIALPLAVFIYAITTVAGALAFVAPGGLGVTEGSMALLLVARAHGLTRAAATTATLITRFCTLWFAVLLGLVALLVVRRRLRGVASAGAPAAPAAGGQ